MGRGVRLILVLSLPCYVLEKKKKGGELTSLSAMSHSQTRALPPFFFFVMSRWLKPAPARLHGFTFSSIATKANNRICFHPVSQCSRPAACQAPADS